MSAIRETNGKRLRLGYLVSRYPAISHTFILREVLELRRAGIEIDAASINGLDRPLAQLTAEEQTEADRTFYVKKAGAAGALAAAFRTALGNPAGFCRGAWFAIRLGGTDPGKIVMSLFYFIEAVMVGMWMRQKNLRHLHIHFATPAATVGLILSRTFPCTISITVHGPDEFYDASAYLLSEKVAGARFLCAIGLFARSQLMKLSPVSDWQKIEITPLGVDASLFAPRPFRSAIDCLEVLCVGRLVPAKGQHILLSAVAKMILEGRKVRLRLVGDGPDRNSLEQSASLAGIRDQVIFEGAVNQDRIRTLYQAADIFALASFAEGIPVVLMEAMAMEIPCVTTWITGIPELIRDSVDGLLVPPSDEVALAAAMSRLMDDSALRRKLGESGRTRVIEKYNLRANVLHLADVFRSHLGAEAELEEAA
jgi:colanic acid/amylovoran biosynthesis glycosyltransferase